LRDPVSSRYVAQLFEAIGTDRLVTLEAHNLAAFQNAFRCDTEHLDADMLFSRRILALIGARDVAVISPDTGGVKRAERFRERLETQLGRPVASGFMEKRRSAGVVSGDTLVADVRDKAVVIVDDLISTGGTMRRAAAACRAAGATAIYAAAAHGLLNRGAGETLSGAEFDRILITDSVPPPPAEAGKITDRLEVVSVAGLFAEAIRRCHSGGSITDLLERGA
jgi:ribose-phosphate pyrophosphokinase